MHRSEKSEAPNLKDARHQQHGVFGYRSRMRWVFKQRVPAPVFRLEFERA
jgi:hypothetical protein